MKVKIVSQLKDGNDSVSFFEGVNVTVRRGTWCKSDKKGLRLLINQLDIPVDKMIFKASVEPQLGSKCKQILLESHGETLSIGTDAPVYILSESGQTIEAIY